MAIDFSPSQLNAIIKRNKNILVSAAAGSGKTAVLIGRIISLIKELRINIDNLLVVTFTNKAAAEMKERFIKEIEEEIRLTTDKSLISHLEKQKILVNKSNIETIDSFCGKVVKNNFHLIDLDPNFKTISDNELQIIKEKVMQEFLEEKYNISDESFINLSDHFAPKYHDNTLEESIFNIYRFASSLPHPIKWLQDAKNMYKASFKEGLFNTPFGAMITDEIKNVLNNAKTIYLNARTLYQSYDNPFPKYEEMLFNGVKKPDDLTIIDTLISQLNNGISDQFLASINDITFQRFPTTTKWDIDDDEINALKTLRDLFKETLKGISNLFPYAYDDANYIFNEQSSYIIELINCVIEFTHKLKNATIEAQVATFNDIEHMCLEILIDENGNPTNSAKEYQEQFYEIFIDEYQDSNYLQEEILTSISRKYDNKNNLFMVGDIKQAIYGFRMATPKLFSEKYETYSEDSQSDNYLIPLSENYRSRASVLDSCNFLFSQLMSTKLGGVTYDSKARLYAKGKYSPSPSDTTTELIVIDAYPKSDEDEKRDTGVCSQIFIAHKISELIGNFDIYNPKDDTYYKARPKDIVILLRDKKNMNAYVEALESRGISAFCYNKSSKLIENQEIKLILAILNLIDNPIQDLYILQVLTSPIYNISYDELANIRINSDKNNYFELINSYIAANNNELTIKLNRFVNDINTYRAFYLENTLTNLIDLIYSESNYYNYCGILENGLLKQTNLNAFKEAVYEFELKQDYTLSSFLEYIATSNIEESVVLKNAENAVQIMTMHSSKGLEFPIVFVADLNKDKNMIDFKKDLILNPDYGIGAIHFDLNIRSKLESIPYILFKSIALKEMLSEEMRLLYVALTRAKEKLFLVGEFNTKNKANFSFLAHREDISIPDYCLINKKTFLYWILMAMENTTLNDNFIIKHNLSLADINSLSQYNKMLNTNKLNEMISIDLNNDYSNQKATIAQNINYIYHNANSQDIPTKLSITELKRMHNNTAEDTIQLYSPIELKKPSFLTEDIKDISGSQKGTIYHTIMEHIDFNNTNNLEDINALLNTLILKNILTKEDINAININKFLHFINSPLFKRIQASNTIYKEAPFVMQVKAYEALGDKYKNSDSTILINGIIDLYFIEDNEIVLVDYKTDYVHEHNIDTLVQKYKIQLDLYAVAIEKYTQMKVKEKIIYSVFEDKEILC